MHTDTIAAIATALGQGGIGIIRISGPESAAIAIALVGKLPKPRVASYRTFRAESGQALDQGIVLYFPAPHSFTGEAVVELQGHGGEAVLNLILQRVVQLGARLARPGEFSERAFLNNRIDLIQAEAIADLIHAGSEQAARAAMRSLQGEFSEQISLIDSKVVTLRTYIEASIDFAEEALDFLSPERVRLDLVELLQLMQSLKASACQGNLLREGINIVIAGPPNAGKSSLLNRLSGQETAIVTAIPGTTRDILKADIYLEGLPIHILDTAGLRVTEDIVEQVGIERALTAIEKADQVLWIVDSTCVAQDYEPNAALSFFRRFKAPIPLCLIRNKVDLSHEPAGLEKKGDLDILRLSATTGEGITVFKDYLKEYIDYKPHAIGFSARQRHINALSAAAKEIAIGLAQWDQDPALEILTVHLSAAHRYLGEVIGLFTTEDLLSSIFSNFCIGK